MTRFHFVWQKPPGYQNKRKQRFVGQARREGFRLRPKAPNEPSFFAEDKKSGGSESSMKVEIKLFANFQEYLPAGSGKYSCFLELEGGTTIGQTLARLNVPESMPMITLVNGIHRDLEEPLHDGDVLSVFPPVAGG
jgi:molybdopterin synthase sulfur carrier subunit